VRADDATFARNRGIDDRPIWTVTPDVVDGSAARKERSAKSNVRSTTPLVVDSCAADGDPGSLRAVITAAANNATLDLSQLGCSTITLTQGEIVVSQDSLYLQGPGAGDLTIDANFDSRVFHHEGAGVFGISGVTIQNGKYVDSTAPRGGCIYSSGNVQLTSSVAVHCFVTGTANQPTLGGGIFTAGYLSLLYSTLSDSEATATNGASAQGGGAYAQANFAAVYSTIARNTATTDGGSPSYAGGIEAGGAVDIEYSTISGNSADFVGGLELFGTPFMGNIVNSTISDNLATMDYGGVWATSTLTFASSTVAFNRSIGQSAGLHSTGPLTLNNSIIADNAGASGPRDLDGNGGPVNGASNIVTAWSNRAPPVGTFSGCPKLEPLADNGGTTWTHALAHSSPAINQGDAGNVTNDQRLAPRGVGAADDIGAVEWQPTDKDERILAAGFDGICDL
jgi:hypothetical protein